MSVACPTCGQAMPRPAFRLDGEIHEDEDAWPPREDAFVVTLWFAVAGCAITPLLMVGTQGGWTPVPSAAHGWLLVGVGVAGFAGQLLLNYGMGKAPAGPASVMRYADLLHALWMQSLLLGDVPNPLKWAGALLVMSSVVSVLNRSRKGAVRARAAAAAAAVPPSELR